MLMPTPSTRSPGDPGRRPGPDSPGQRGRRPGSPSWWSCPPRPSGWRWRGRGAGSGEPAGIAVHLGRPGVVPLGVLERLDPGSGSDSGGAGAGAAAAAAAPSPAGCSSGGASGWRSSWSASCGGASSSVTASPGGGGGRRDDRSTAARHRVCDAAGQRGRGAPGPRRGRRSLPRIIPATLRDASILDVPRETFPDRSGVPMLMFPVERRPVTGRRGPIRLARTSVRLADPARTDGSRLDRRARRIPRSWARRVHRRLWDPRVGSRATGQRGRRSEIVPSVRSNHGRRRAARGRGGTRGPRAPE